MDEFGVNMGLRAWDIILLVVFIFMWNLATRTSLLPSACTLDLRHHTVQIVQHQMPSEGLAERMDLWLNPA